MRELISHIGFILRLVLLKLFLDHSWLQEGWEDLEVPNLMAQIVLSWTAPAA